MPPAAVPKMVPEGSTDLDLTASRWIPHAPVRVWAACSTKEGIERWWSPPDLRTTVRRWDLRPGGDVVFHLRYVPAILTPSAPEAFRAAGVPISFNLRGQLSEVHPGRLLTMDLTLDVGKAGAGVRMITRLEIVPEGSGTRVSLLGRGQGTPHWAALGQRNLEAQLERLEQVLDTGGSP